MTLSDLAKYSMTQSMRGLAVIAELLVSYAPNAVASLHCQENQQNCYTASLSRLEMKLKPAVLTLFLWCPGEHYKKVEGHIKKFSTGVKPSTFKLFPAPLIPTPKTLRFGSIS